MVRILANGEIVADSDKRAGPSQSRNTDAQSQQRNNVHTGQADREPVAHGPDGSVFDGLNTRLSGLGVPRWNMGSWLVEPIVSAGFLASLLLIGVHGLLFAVGLFAVSKYSSEGSPRGGAGAPPRAGGATQGGGGFSSWRGGGGGGGGGSGHRLGRS